MKKIFAIILTLCLMAGVLSITAFAAYESEADIVLGIRMQTKDGEIISFGSYAYFDEFDDGWNEAIGLALDEEFMEQEGYERVVVDLYADWTGDEDGYLTDDFWGGEGFSKHTIDVPRDVKVTLNMNGHTIDRAMTDWDSAGHVIYVDEGADLIINDGTITGGWSSSNAGCIHVPYKANVTLNNVNIVGNTADDADGGGIALYDGATLVMNGGSFTDNVLTGTTTGDRGGALYVDKSTAILNGVEFKNNISEYDDSYGTAIYAVDSRVAMDNCTFEGNGLVPTERVFYQSIIYAKDSTLTATNSTFKNNRAEAMFMLYDVSLTVTACEFTGSTETDCLIKVPAGDASLYVTDTNFTDNKACVIRTDGDSLSTDSMFKNCTFKNTKNEKGVAFSNNGSPLTFYDCDMEYTVIKTTINIVNSTVSDGEAAIGVSGLLADGTVAFTEYYEDIEYAWTRAIKTAMTNEYDRIVVDLYKDWVADEDGQFTDDLNNDSGFDWDAIHIPENVRITLNLNGHKIDRSLEDAEKNGEVICIDNNADVIISDGTITGGHSNNGAGGIHIHDGANVTLNNVSVSGNIVENDDGAAIAVYDGATLTMNGGSIENNLVFNTEFFFGHSYGALYLSDASAVLNDVKISHNRIGGYHTSRGVVIYLDDSNLIMKNCTVTDNGHQETIDANSIICVNGGTSTLDVTGCKFENNGIPGYASAYLFDIEDGTLKMKDSICINNSSSSVIYCDDGFVEVTNTKFEANIAGVFYGTATGESKFDSCDFIGNNPGGGYYVFCFEDGNRLEFTNCDFGDSSFNDRSRATFDGKHAASIFGEGSLSMIVAIVALIAAAASIWVNVSSKKKALAVGEAENAEESETEESAE